MKKHTRRVVTRAQLFAAAQRVDEIAQAARTLLAEADGFEKELAVAQALQDLRALLTPKLMAPVLGLMNTSLGFRTDRDPKAASGDPNGLPATAYGLEVVRECFIEAKLRGFLTLGNEWSIIAGRFRACKNGFRRKIIRSPGLTDFRDQYHLPPAAGNRATSVRCSATWKCHGLDDGFECELPVEVSPFSGPEAILDEAERRFLQRVHDRLTGANTPVAEVGQEGPALAGVRQTIPVAFFGSAPDPSAATTTSTGPTPASPGQGTPPVSLESPAPDCPPSSQPPSPPPTQAAQPSAETPPVAAPQPGLK